MSVLRAILIVLTVSCYWINFTISNELCFQYKSPAELIVRLDTFPRLVEVTSCKKFELKNNCKDGIASMTVEKSRILLNASTDCYELNRIIDGIENCRFMTDVNQTVIRAEVDKTQGIIHPYMRVLEKDIKQIQESYRTKDHIYYMDSLIIYRIKHTAEKEEAYFHCESYLGEKLIFCPTGEFVLKDPRDHGGVFIDESGISFTKTTYNNHLKTSYDNQPVPTEMKEYINYIASKTHINDLKINFPINLRGNLFCGNYTEITAFNATHFPSHRNKPIIWDDEVYEENKILLVEESSINLIEKWFDELSLKMKVVLMVGVLFILSVLKAVLSNIICSCCHSRK